MTKELITKMRETFSTSILKVTCDNMIILYDNTGIHPNLIWDDGAETVTALRINTETSQQTHPIEVFATNYEHIQYIEAFINPANAKEWIDANITDGEQKKLAEKLFQTAVSKRSYTGTTAMKNIDTI